MPDLADQLTTSVATEVPAILWLKPEYGPERPATKDDLRAMRFKHENDMYDRLRELFDKMGVSREAVENDRRWSMLRYFIEYVTHYEHDMDDDDLALMRSIIESAAPVGDDA